MVWRSVGVAPWLGALDTFGGVMQQGTATVIGTAVTDVRHTVTRDGQSLARFRAVVRPRRFDRQSDQWVDQEPSFVSVICWRTLADNVVASVVKGDPVIVSGRLRVREWQNGDRQGIDVEVEAVSVGHDLCRGASRFTRSRARPVLGSADEAGADAGSNSDRAGPPTKAA